MQSAGSCEPGQAPHLAPGGSPLPPTRAEIFQGVAVHASGRLSDSFWRGAARCWVLAQRQEKDLGAPLMKPACKKLGKPREEFSLPQGPAGWGQRQQNQIPNDAPELLLLRFKVEGISLYFVGLLSHSRYYY